MVGVMAITASGIVGLVLALPGATPIVLAPVERLFRLSRLSHRHRAAAGGSRSSSDRQPPFAGGIFLSLVNPKGYAAMAALFSSFVLIRERLDAGRGREDRGAVCIIAAVNIAWLIAGAALTRYLQGPAHQPDHQRDASRSCLIASVGVALLV